jgi:type I restriction enzyme S subunit
MAEYKYKETEIEWLNTAPLHWNVRRLFNICTFIRGNSSFQKNDLLDVGNYVALQYGKTYKVDKINESFKFYVNDEFYKKSQTVNYGDVIFVSTSETLEDLGHSVFYNREDVGLIGGEQILIKPNKNIIDEKYLFYSSKVYGKELKKYATGIKVFRFDIYDLKTIYQPLPPLPEQKAIADYLDKACQRIDKIIDIKQRQIKLLTQNQTSTLFNVLTRGLDKEAEFIEPEIHWMDQMPFHWIKKRVKDVVTLKSGDSITSNSINDFDNIPVFGGNGFRGYTTSYTHEGEFALIGRQGALCGNINYAKGKFWASEHAVVCTPVHQCSVLWIGELLRVMDLNQYSNAAAQPGLAVEKIKQLYLPVPPYEEQKIIADYINSLTNKNQLIIENITNQINTLKAYRKSLIHECVTGKKQIWQGDIERVS